MSQKMNNGFRAGLTPVARFFPAGAAGLALGLTVCFALLGLSPNVLADTARVDSAFTPPPPELFEVLPKRLSPDHNTCLYPVKSTGAVGSAALLQPKATLNARVVTQAEIEPNDEPMQAQFVGVNSAIGNEIDATVTGKILPGTEQDYFRIFAYRGDILGIVVTTNRDEFDFRPEYGLDPVVAICDLTGDVLVENDDDRGLSSIYPPSSPFPRIETPAPYGARWDSALTWVVPETGDYLIRVTSFASSRNGDYELKIVPRRPSFEHQAVGATQIIFLDFDGVSDFNSVAPFGMGWYVTELTGLRYFLPGWGLTYEDESEVIDAILAVVHEKFDDLRAASLNGDRDVDFVDGHFDYEIRNSRDHVDPWGQPNVSRVIVGGSMFELGIPTLGIAESIDPGNFDREETAVVLLDFLSDPDPTNLDSVNSLQLAGGVTIFDAIGEVVGTIVAHEASHYLGLWHTDHDNEIQSVIDQGGDGIYNEAGVGPDGVFGTGDDTPMFFVPDFYTPSEMIATGLELTDVRTAFAMATGKNLNVVPPPPPDEELPQVSISAMPKIGQAPLAVSFAGGGVDPTGGKFVVFNWNFGDQTSGTGAFVTHTYNRPGTYVVTMTGTTDGAATAQTVTEVVVLSQPNQLPEAFIVASPSKGDAPLMVLFEALASDPDGSIIGYAWDFGDGQTGMGQSIDHVYLSQGVYVATLSVTDNIGAVRRVTTTITVYGSSTSGNASANDGFAAPIPMLNTCGAGTPAALTATLIGLMGMALIRRRF